MKTAIRLLLGLLLLSCISATAQNVELYGGYGYLAQNSSAGGFTNLNGWATGVEVGIPRVKNLSLAADFRGTYNNQEVFGVSQNLRQYTYLFGPRVSQRLSRVRIFEHAMIGAARFKGTLGGQSDSATSVAFALGAGVDLQLNKHVSIRPAEFDYLLTRLAEKNQNNFRYSSGFVFRF